MRLLQFLCPRGGTAPPPVLVPTTVMVAPTPFTVTIGAAAVQLAATVKDQFGNPMAGQVITWSSSDNAKATVDGTGLVTGLVAGAVTITATCGAVHGDAAGTVAAAADLSWQDNAYPHSSTGLLIAYTDFRTGNFPDPQRTTERQENQLLADKLISSGEPPGGYPAGLIHQPYILTSFVETCVSDAGSVWNLPLIRTEKDYLAYCTAHALDPEDGYLHYGAGQPTYAVPITSIDATGKVTLAYDLTTYASMFANGQSVTIAGASNPAHNGTFAISAVGVTGGANDVNGDLVNAKTTFTIPVTGQTSAGGTVKRVGDGSKTKGNRFIFFIGTFPPPRWCVNHAHPTRIAYERDRYNRIFAGTLTGLDFVPEGVYVDEIAQNNLVTPANAVTAESNPANETQFYADVATLYAALRADHPAPWAIELGTASYSSPLTATMLDDGSRSGQYEGMLNTRTGGNWSPAGSLELFIKNRIAAGVHGEMCTPYVPADNPPGGGGNYAADPVPAGMNGPHNVRMLASGLAIALHTYDPIGKPGTTALNVWNGGWGLASLSDMWCDLYKVPLGLPVAAAVNVGVGVTDPLGQTIVVTRRDFQGGMVLYRELTTSSPQRFDDGSAAPIALPPSGGFGDLWQRVCSDGSRDVPTSNISLRVDEGVVLLPAVAPVLYGPDPLQNPTSGVVINVGDNWQTKVNANPAGTSFWIKAGVHVNQSVVPKTGNSFLAEAGAIMDGSGTTVKAIAGTASNVTIRNLLVRNYAAPVSSGPIQGDWNQSTGWIMEHIESTGHPGAGLYVTDQCQVRFCKVHHNGQIGLLGKCNNSTIEFNEISFNNQNNNDINNEAGGLKILQSQSVQFRFNYVHDNIGHGIWFDGYNYLAVIERNRVENNVGAGIMYEISYNGLIQYNRVTGNGGTWAFTRSGIFISSSPNCTVKGNYLADNSNGVVGLDVTRGRSSDPTLDRGALTLTGLTCLMNTTDLPRGGVGLADQNGTGAVFLAAANNKFSRNWYYTHARAQPFFVSGNGTPGTLAQWQALSQDITAEVH